MFQSPSLRGSGRFMQPSNLALPSGGMVSIPFIAGQWSLHHGGAAWSRQVGLFQSPSLRGSGRFGGKEENPWNSSLSFQSPSLRGSGRFGRRPRRLGTACRRFNPLHCGAVVASRRLSARRCAAAHRFNPLHCGAVVASRRRPVYGRHRRPVSIPFIAGQWSLPASRCARSSASSRFNPLHCGAVVASYVVKEMNRDHFRFQSPSLRGSGRFSNTATSAP